MGYQLREQIFGDASAALGIIHRKGLGKTWHIDVSYLWVQEVVAQRRLAFTKVLGKENPIDRSTKYLDVATMDKHVSNLDCKTETDDPVQHRNYTQSANHGAILSKNRIPMGCTNWSRSYSKYNRGYQRHTVRRPGPPGAT